MLPQKVKVDRRIRRLYERPHPPEEMRSKAKAFNVTQQFTQQFLFHFQNSIEFFQVARHPVSTEIFIGIAAGIVIVNTYNDNKMYTYRNVMSKCECKRDQLLRTLTAPANSQKWLAISYA